MRKSLIVLSLLFSIGCASKTAPIQTQVSYNFGLAMQGILAVQESTIALNSAKILTDDKTNDILDAIKKVNEGAKVLSAALKAWDAAGAPKNGANFDYVRLVLQQVDIAFEVLRNTLPPEMMSKIDILRGLLDFANWLNEVRGGTPKNGELNLYLDSIITSGA